ncbi:YidH family protein [Brevibacillus thermoruber]|uniref:YidH family protein n=1 Tax=Brevibacillus thermoruber TaxID=33942 RepID=UPI000557D2A9|nr:DUF202 domain-containing protein [Brevibacillus thermoruber]
MEKTTDSKFVQQHLANERTFLAWIRTSITIVGLGFLAVGVVFRTSPYTQLGHLISSIVGIGSVLFGTVLVILSTKEYLKKRAGINNETFLSSKALLLMVATSLIFINLFLLVLVFIVIRAC